MWIIANDIQKKYRKRAWYCGSGSDGNYLSSSIFFWRSIDDYDWPIVAHCCLYSFLGSVVNQ